ncbi:helix-turn-helix transcriptional regulator [Massilia sp. BJB1822]|uniref:helix-turn-helix transcriptional regulator n=1 Tax=Massilia sp. BJB1822 TaxID=2744470 RepID=UPI001593A46C|nr:helix-turn-helix transcriptional regulator [Massilia sp. BJB1822]NVD98437.1 helix-turn-helix transcriptional regulator [Massilia sp. BJB1822]
MNSYHLLSQALEPRDASSPRLFSYAVMSAVNGFVPHADYVRQAADAERAPPSDQTLEEQVGLLLACDANPLSELVQCAANGEQFAERWNGINRKVSLGVATLVEGPGLSRQPQQGRDSPLRQRVMHAFIDQLKPGSHSPGLGRGERRLEAVARHVGAGSAMIELTEALYDMPDAELFDCAGALGCSARTLQRQLTRNAVTFGQVKQAVRICMSAALLRNGDASLTEVALAAGFYDSAHFSRAMKLSSGLSPSEYRLLSA